MLSVLDGYINKITTYRIVLYGLTALVLFSFLNFKPLDIILSLAVILISAVASNKILASFEKIPVNIESQYITSFIIFLLFTPTSEPKELLTLALVSILAMIAKYLFVINNSHVFNPAAMGAFLAGLLLGFPATWWVGSGFMFPAILIVGFVIIRKMRKITVFIVFVIFSLISILFNNFSSINSYSDALLQIFTTWPIIFFGTVMLTEPFTLPGRKNIQLIIAAIVGLLFGARFHFGPIYATPEFAIIIGNLISFILDPRARYKFQLKQMNWLNKDICEFIFETGQKVKFTPGQFMEWTLSHAKSDSRGIRRYFTIASSPTESSTKLGIKFNNPGSSFKTTLANLKTGDHLYAGQVGGDFTLKSTNNNYVFIAGGIGVTPFRSIIKNLVDTNTKVNIILFYLAKRPEDFVYKELFEIAEKVIGLKTYYVVSDKEGIPLDWPGLRGFLTEDIIKNNVPDYQTTLYYGSGPNAMVETYSKLLTSIGVPRKNIVKDFFPGF